MFYLFYSKHWGKPSGYPVFWGKMKYFASDLCTFCFLVCFFNSRYFTESGVLFQLNRVSSVALRYKVKWRYQKVGLFVGKDSVLKVTGSMKLSYKVSSQTSGGHVLEMWREV